MPPISDRSAPPPDALRDLHRRLSAVLADLMFPAQRWQLVAVADLYGVDGVTRAILERAPEQRYHSLPEVVAVIGALMGGRPVAPVPAPTVPAPRPAPASHPVAPRQRATHATPAQRTPTPAA